MDTLDHARMSRQVRETIEKLHGEPLNSVANAIARVVNREYALEEADAAAAHWREVFNDAEAFPVVQPSGLLERFTDIGTPSAESKDHWLETCRSRHMLWQAVIKAKNLFY